MKKYIRLIVLIFILNLTASSQVLAMGQETAVSPTIIHAIQHSGFTTPESAFENYCEVSESGHINGYSHEGWTGNRWAAAKSYDFQLRSKTLKALKKAILRAREGVLSSGPRVCDRGTIHISARVDSDVSAFIVVEAEDCNASQVNEQRAALLLRSFVEKQCKIKY